MKYLCFSNVHGSFWLYKNQNDAIYTVGGLYAKWKLTQWKNFEEIVADLSKIGDCRFVDAKWLKLRGMEP